MADDTRPEPIQRAEQTVGRATAALGSLIAGAATFGILTPLEADAGSALLDSVNLAVPAVGGALVTVLGAGVSLWSMIQTRLQARRHVTPLVDPVDDRGEPLSRVADGLAAVTNERP